MHFSPKTVQYRQGSSTKTVKWSLWTSKWIPRRPPFPHDPPRANRTKTAPEAQAPLPVNIKVIQINVYGGGSKFKRPHSLARDHNASVVVVCELKTSKEQQEKLKKDKKKLNLQSHFNFGSTRKLLKGGKKTGSNRKNSEETVALPRQVRKGKWPLPSPVRWTRSTELLSFA